MSDLRMMVVDKKSCKRDGVYIGRPSVLGNPYKLDSYGRLKAITRYEIYLRELVEKRDERIMNELCKILRLARRPEGVRLICWCHPLPCHGDVIKKIIIEMEDVLDKWMENFNLI